MQLLVVNEHMVIYVVTSFDNDSEIFTQQGVTFSSAATTAVVSIPDTVENNNALISCAALLFGITEFSDVAIQKANP